MNKKKLKQILKKINDPSYQIEVSEHSDSTKASANADVIFKIQHILRKEDPNTWKAWHDAVYCINYNFPMETPSYFGRLIVGFSAQEEHFSLLQVATSSGYTNVMKALIGKGADIVELIAPASVNRNNRRFTKKERAEERKKPIVNRKDILGRTLLHLAAQSGNTETVQFLLDNGAEIDAKDKYERTPLFLAALRGDKKMVQFLLDKKADIYEKNDKNQSLLHLAVIEKNIAAVPILLEEGLDPHAQDNSSNTPMDLAQDSSIKWALKNHIPNKLYWAVLRRDFKAADKILNNCSMNESTDEMLGKLMDKKRAIQLDEKSNEDIIKAIQQTQAISFACGGGFAAVIGIPIAIALPLSYAMTPGIIAATTIAGAAGLIGLLCIGFAVFHAFKEFPSAQVNEPRSTGAGEETPNLG